MASQLLNKIRGEIKPVVANVERILNPITEFTRANPLTTGATLGTIGGAVATVGITKIVGAVKKRSKKKSKSKKAKRKSRTKRKRKHKHKYRRTPRTAGKGKDRSTKRIRYTKKGQPYIILRSGKARFIKKSNAKRSHKMKGGRY